MKTLWVVEMWNPSTRRGRHGTWMPTIGTTLFRDDGLIELSRWKGNNPGDMFRLVRYERTYSGRVYR